MSMSTSLASVLNGGRGCHPCVLGRPELYCYRDVVGEWCWRCLCEELFSLAVGVHGVPPYDVMDPTRSWRRVQEGLAAAVLAYPVYGVMLTVAEALTRG